MGKKFFIQILIIFLSWGSPSTIFAMTPSQKIWEIAYNFGKIPTLDDKGVAFWSDNRVCAALKGLCKADSIAKILEISRAEVSNPIKQYLFVFLRFLTMSKYWDRNDISDFEKAILYENQIILIEAFCQIVGFEIIRDIMALGVTIDLIKFMVENPSDLTIDLPFNSRYSSFILRKIDLLCLIIDMFCLNDDEMAEKTIKFYRAIIESAKTIDPDAICSRMVKFRLDLSCASKSEPKVGQTAKKHSRRD